MQDFKHLTQKKRYLSLGAPAANRKLVSPPPSRAPRAGAPWRRIGYGVAAVLLVLALIPATGFVYRTLPAVSSRVMSWFDRGVVRSPRVAEAAKPPVSLFENASVLLPTASINDGKLSAQTPSGDRLEYSIMGNLQQRIHDYLAHHEVPYGVFVALEPATGRILAMTAYSSVQQEWARTAFFELYPMASLFKIVTASAALEAGKINPDTVIEFRGKATSESPRYWEATPRGRNNRMDVTYAMGKSINPVYGRLACDIAGKESVMEQVRRFGFNQAILSGVQIVKSSRAGEPASNHGLMLMGAGLDHDVKVSPVHAAMIMASIANGGRMMAPSLTDRVVDGAGSPKDAHVPRELARPVTAATSAALTRMLSTTVTTGTSRKAFHDRRGRPVLAGIDIAAKTGSINGDDPKGHYSWFGAYAPAREPRIALVALVINGDKWKIKASQVGQQALEEFFRN